MKHLEHAGESLPLIVHVERALAAIQTKRAAEVGEAAELGLLLQLAVVELRRELSTGASYFDPGDRLLALVLQ